MNPYINDKQQTQDIKKFLNNHSQNKIVGQVPKDRKGGPGAPDNRTLPIRGNR
jgi:hypothetical protein